MSIVQVSCQPWVERGHDIISFTDLMHEVSLRSASNRMDAHNLALVLCPNLISGPNPARDVVMCSIPGGPSLYDSMPTPRSNPAALAEGKSTLGMVIKVCIQRYYEVFDEVHDRSEAIPPQRSFHGEVAPLSPSSSESGSSLQHRNGNDDDEDIDDAMLVMPIGPSQSHETNAVRNRRSSPSPPPSAWAAGGAAYKPRHRSTNSGGSSSGVRSMHTVLGESASGSGNTGGGYSYASMSKAKSMISIEKGGPVGTTGRKGSISVGRGTTRKSTGAGVEAIGITAEGFFSAPSSAPPVPPKRGVRSDQKMNGSRMVS